MMKHQIEVIASVEDVGWSREEKERLWPDPIRVRFQS